jgi:ABC-type multidrug transport system fused ATPase/permease subunit
VAQREQSKLLMRILWEQKWLLFLNLPFMFFSSIGDFLFPNFIGNILSNMQVHDADNVRYYLIVWVIVIFVGALSTMANGIISGYISERLGNSLRKKLFSSLIYKDTAFYDESRTGDLCKFTSLV